MRKSLLKLSFLLIILMAIPFFIEAAECNPGDTDYQERQGGCGEYERRYKCDSNTACGADILVQKCDRKQDRTRHCTVDSDGDGIPDSWNDPPWSSCYNTTDSCYTTTKDTCDTWELCVGAVSPSWQGGIPACSCEGYCLADPPNPLLQDGIGDISNLSARLPIYLKWDIVSGANSYRYRNWETYLPSTTSWEFSMATTTGTTTNTNIIPGEASCVLKSTSTYSWKTSPCCASDGSTDCKDWDEVSTSSYETSLSPEMVGPLDPDWNQTTQWALEIDITETLDWCDVDEATYYKIKLIHLVGAVENVLDEIKIDVPPSAEPSSHWNDHIGYYFQPNNHYRWQVVTCLPDGGVDLCSEYSQKWGFTTTSTLPDSTFDLISPPDDSDPANSVAVPTLLKWTNKIGYNSFYYEVTPTNPAGPVISGTTTGSSGVTLDLNLNTHYEWTAKACTDHSAQNCGALVLPRWDFWTTGRRPVLTNPPLLATDVVLPVNLAWDEVSGSGFYSVDVAKGAPFLPANIIWQATTSNTFVKLDHPTLSTSTWYSWRARSCAYGIKCGQPSFPIGIFMTFDLSVPTTTEPADGTVIDKPMNITFTWDAVAGAKAYHYIITSAAGTEIINRIIPSNSITHSPTEFPKTGVYEWIVRACLDTACTAPSQWSNGGTPWSFDLALIAPVGARGGLVPCGRTMNDPDTPWDETERCGILHLFLLLRSILHFILWKIATVLLVLMLTIAGVMLFLDWGTTEMIIRIKSLTKSLIFGYLLIFFAWFITNFILGLLGYDFGLWGRWWEISL